MLIPACAHNTSQHQQKAQTHKFYGCYADPEADCRHPFICWTWIIQQKLPDFAAWHVEASRLQSNTSCKLIKWPNYTQLSLQAWQVLPHQKDAPPLHSGYNIWECPVCSWSMELLLDLHNLDHDARLLLHLQQACLLLPLWTRVHHKRTVGTVMHRSQVFAAQQSASAQHTASCTPHNEEHTRPWC